MQQINKLRNLIKNIFIKKGLNLKHSKLCANALINAELVGAPSHGLSRLKISPVKTGGGSFLEEEGPRCAPLKRFPK